MVARLAWLAVSILRLADFAPAQMPRRPTTSPDVTRTGYYIRGSVRFAANDATAEMVRVDLKRFTGDVLATAFTRSQGEFEFNGLPNGTYYLTIEMEGYEPVREMVEVINSPRVGIFIYLKKAETFGPRESGHAISARELALPRKAREAMQKGLERLYDRDDSRGSVSHFQKVLSDAPEFYEAHFHIGVAYMKQNLDAQAEASLRRSIDLSQGEYAEPHFVLGSLLSSRNDLSGAEVLLRRGLELDANSWQGHYELARVLVALDRLDEAEKLCREGHRLNASYAPLHLVTANIHIRRKEYPALLAELDEYLKLEPAGEMSDQARQMRDSIRAALAKAQNQPPQPPRKP